MGPMEDGERSTIIFGRIIELLASESVMVRDRVMLKVCETHKSPARHDLLDMMVPFTNKGSNDTDPN